MQNLHYPKKEHFSVTNQVNKFVMVRVYIRLHLQPDLGSGTKDFKKVVY